METVSIIIPVYNVEKELAVCINSVLAQTYNNIEVIIVNDGSTDKSAQIIAQYAKKDPRILVIEQKNKGVSAARNKGIKVAKGEFIAFVDSDDWLDDQYIEKMIKCIKETNADVVECGYRQKKDYESDDFSSYPRQYNIISGTKTIIEKHLKGEISVLVWNKLYKSALIKDIAFVEGIEYEDVLWTCAMLKETNCIAAVKEPLYNWRERMGSISRRQFDGRRFAVLERFETRVKMLEDICDEVKIIGKIGVIVECCLELQAANNTCDRELMFKAKKHSQAYYKKWKLSLKDFMKIRSSKEKIKYTYYCIKYQYAMIRNIAKCKKVI